MRIGLVSDTHIPEAGHRLPDSVRQAFSGVDLILHAGDLHVLSVLDWLEELAPVIAVRGNGDYGGGGRGLVPPDPRLADHRILELEGLRVGLTHGVDFSGYSNFPSDGAMQLVQRRFPSGVDVLVFGDSHVPVVRWFEGVLFVNPGSPTVPYNRYDRPGTVALLEIRDGQAEARIIELPGRQR